jgi:hypothetical protein
VRTDKQTDRQTERNDEANNRFSQFCERTQHYILSYLVLSSPNSSVCQPPACHYIDSSSRQVISQTDKLSNVTHVVLFFKRASIYSRPLATDLSAFGIAFRNVSRGKIPIDLRSVWHNLLSLSHSIPHYILSHLLHNNSH